MNARASSPWPPLQVGFRSPAGSTAGFTRTDALALLALTAILALIALPATANGERKSRALNCQANLRRLSLAWTLFANDHADTLVRNVHGALAQSPVPSAPEKQGWATGWLDWGSFSQNTNIAYLVRDDLAALASYLSHDATVFRCPDDTYVSAQQRGMGWRQRVRSYSCNVGIGPGNAEEGPWDPSTFAHVTKMSGFVIPGPMDSAVFLEENADSINDPALMPPLRTQWIDLPASYHNGGAFVTFGDGHCTLIRWQSQQTLRPVRLLGYGGATVLDSDPDVRWLRYHTPRRTEEY